VGLILAVMYERAMVGWVLRISIWPTLKRPTALHDCMSNDPEGQSRSDIGRVLVLNDPPARATSARGGPTWQGPTPVPFSAQPEPFLSLLDVRHPTYPTNSAYGELKKWRSVSPCYPACLPQSEPLPYMWDEEQAADQLMGTEVFTRLLADLPVMRDDHHRVMVWCCHLQPVLSVPGCCA